MKKIKLTEKQMTMINEFVQNESDETPETINESVLDDRYRRDGINVSLYYSGVNYKGFELNDITCGDLNMVFSIEVEHKSWGIRDISVYGIEGIDDELELEVDYFSNDDNDYDTKQEIVTVKLNWEDLQVNKREGEGVVTIGDDIEITLENDSEGNIVVKSMEIEALTI